MSNTSTGGPAFPQDYTHTRVLIHMQQDGDISAKDLQKLSKQLAGMTLRDYFAASFVSSGHVFTHISPGDTPELVAQQAYMMADAMLKAREA